MGISVPDSAIHERFIRASGPGGQNVNKVATAVELRVDLAAAGLSDAVRQRVVTLAHNRINADGVLVIDSRQFRTQAQNRAAARERLAELLERASKPRRKRRPTKPTKAAREERLTSKHRRATVKKTRARGEDE